MKILITGATGFVGGALAGKLAVDNIHEIIATYRDSPKELPTILRWVKIGDLGTDSEWALALSGVEVVVHTAAKVNNVGELEEFRKVNVLGTLQLARQAAIAGTKRFIFISSVKVNGEITHEGRPFTADDISAPTSAYSISKIEAEKGLRAICKETGVELVIIRPPMVYGAGTKGNFAALLNLVKSRIPLPFGALDNKRSMVGIDNLVDLINLCITHPAAANQLFMVSDGKDLSVAEFISHIEKALCRSSRLFPFPKNLLGLLLKLLGKGEIAQSICGPLRVDISKTKEILGWSPPFAIEEILKKAVDQ